MSFSMWRQIVVDSVKRWVWYGAMKMKVLHIIGVLVFLLLGDNDRKAIIQKFKEVCMFQTWLFDSMGVIHSMIRIYAVFQQNSKLVRRVRMTYRASYRKVIVWIWWHSPVAYADIRNKSEEIDHLKSIVAQARHNIDELQTTSRKYIRYYHALIIRWFVVISCATVVDLFIV